MKQLLVQKGNLILEELPTPAISDNEILVKTHYSLISTGTELAGISISKESLLTRALHQPHNVKKALKMAGEKGVLATYKLIKGMLDFGTPTGYSLSGEVIEVGKNITDIKIGDFVGCSGAGIANHAEFVAVPRLLASKIPQNLDLRQAASVTLGAIAMQGVRQANPKLGETVAVIGLGLLGQITCQILRAAGCRVIGLDLDGKRVQLAKKLGTADLKPVNVDATIITASAESNEPLNQAMEITRRKGTVVVVGAVGLNLKRNPWYEKEIDLKISCSYGPGRYDSTYEEEMLDYPLPFVRWTENRNMEEYLNLLAEGKVNFLALEPGEFSFEDAQKAYSELQESRPLAVLLKYSADKKHAHEKIFVSAKKHESKGKIKVAVIGAGSFATITHLPNLEKLRENFSLKAIVSKKGLTAKQLAKRYNADYCTADYEEVLKDSNVDAVLILTRHNLHAKMVLDALKAGKHVFVEKPLALNENELNEIKNFYLPAEVSAKAENLSARRNLGEGGNPILTVGFNRRFSPCAKRVKELTQNRKNPMIINYRMNAGYLSPDHWTQKPEGGGRIIGEACHIFDLFNFWTSSAPKKITALSINPKTKDILSQDNFSATILYEDGSVCNLIYTALGHKDLPKEYAEIYCDGKVLVLDDYKKVEVKGGGGGLKTFSQNKGHLSELEAFAHGIQKGHFPIPLEELFSATEISFEVNKLATHGS